MNRLVVLLFVLCADTVARGETPSHASKKTVPITTIVEIADDFPDYAFFEVRYSSIPGIRSPGKTFRVVTLHFFVPGASLQATGTRLNGGTLYAIPRAVAEHISSWPRSMALTRQKLLNHTTIPTSDEKWLVLAQAVNQGEVPGASWLPFGTTVEVPFADVQKAITVNYRLARTSAGVAFVHPDDPIQNRLPNPKSGEQEDERAWRWTSAGSLSAFAIMLVGMWLVKRPSHAHR